MILVLEDLNHMFCNFAEVVGFLAKEMLNENILNGFSDGRYSVLCCF